MICEETALPPPLCVGEHRSTDAFTPGPLAHALAFPRKRRRAVWWLAGLTLLAVLGGTAALLASRARSKGGAPSFNAPSPLSPPFAITPPLASSVPNRGPTPATPMRDSELQRGELLDSVGNTRSSVGAPSSVAKDSAAKPVRHSGKRKPEAQRPTPSAATAPQGKPAAASVESVLDHRR